MVWQSKFGMNTYTKGKLKLIQVGKVVLSLVQIIFIQFVSMPEATNVKKILLHLTFVHRWERNKRERHLVQWGDASDGGYQHGGVRCAYNMVQGGAAASRGQPQLLYEALHGKPAQPAQQPAQPVRQRQSRRYVDWCLARVLWLMSSFLPKKTSHSLWTSKSIIIMVRTQTVTVNKQ